MYKIKKLNKISPVINNIFDSRYEVGEVVENPDGIIVRSFNMAEYIPGENLVGIARAGAGVNNIPVAKMTDMGIAVFNTPGANANAVKELTILAMLVASRDVIGGNIWVNTLQEDVEKTAEKGKSQFGGGEIMGKTVGIIGLGAIGSAVANTCVKLGMKVLGYARHPEKVRSSVLPEVEIVPLEKLYAESDFISIHVPYSDSTKNFIATEEIKQFKKGAILINMSRGGIVDINAVKAGIAEGKIAKYVVDFPDKNVLNSKNIIVFPHLGASTEEAEDNCAYMAGKQLVDFIENGNVKNSVNYPALKKDRTGAVRTCMFLKKENADFLDKYCDKAVAERGDYLYVIVDGEEKCVPPTNVIKTRYL